MGNPNGKDNNNKTSTAIFSAIAGALFAGLISWGVTKYSVEREAAITLSFVKEQFGARVDEYPKLWKILRPLSSQSKVGFTPELGRSISQELNAWMYDRGGLVAHQNTRSLVFQLRNALAKWEPSADWKSGGPPPKEITSLKDDIIYACRIDLYLVSRRDVDIATLREYIKKRNKELEELEEKIKPL